MTSRGVRLSVDAEVRGSDEFKIWFFYAWLWTGALLQGGLAFVLPVRRPASTVAESCFCTLAAGLLMGVAMLAANVAFGGGLGLGFVVNTLCQFANCGALVALPMAALGSGIRFVVTGFRPLPFAAVAARRASPTMSFLWTETGLSNASWRMEHHPGWVFRTNNLSTVAAPVVPSRMWWEIGAASGEPPENLEVRMLLTRNQLIPVRTAADLFPHEHRRRPGILTCATGRFLGGLVSARATPHPSLTR
jgi:hypothetical protein